MDKDDIRDLIITLKGMQVEINELESKLKGKTEAYLSTLHQLFDKEKITPIDAIEWTLETLEND